MTSWLLKYRYKTKDIAKAIPTATKKARLLLRKSIFAFIPNRPMNKVDGASVVEKVVSVLMFLFNL